MQWGLLGRPAFAGAVAVLAVNDHVLKPLAGSWWTGKLSDVAGVFVVTVLVGALTGRPRPAGLAVAVGFSAVKLVPAAAVAVAPLLGGVTRTDATDLVALVAIVPAVALVERPGARVRGVGAIAGVVALLATTATSASQPAGVDAFVVGEDGTVAARISDGDSVPELRWATSSDGGRTWASLDLAPEAPASEAKEGCAPSIGCFRVTRGVVQQREGDTGPWLTAFAFTDEQWERMNLRVGLREVADPSAVAIADLADGTHVIVGMEDQGVLHRGPDGRWERRAVLDLDPVSIRGPSWLVRMIFVPLTVMVLGPVVILLARARRRLVPSLVAFVGGGSIFVVGGIAILSGADYATGGVWIAVLSVLVFVGSLVLAWQPQKSLVVGDGGTPP